MSELHEMNTDLLIDLLAEYTSRYTRLFAEKKFDMEYEEAKEKIKKLVAILEQRKVVKNDTVQTGRVA